MRSHVPRLNFKTSHVGVYKYLSLIVSFAIIVAIWPREVVSCHDFILRAVATFWALSLVGIYPCRASYMPTLLDYPGISQIQHQSARLLDGSPNLPNKMGSWSYELFCASVWKLSHFLPKFNFFFPFIFRFLAHFCTYFITDKDYFAITIINRILVCTTCKTSYNVLSHSHVIN